MQDAAECVDITGSHTTQDPSSDPNQCATTVIKSKQQQIKPELIPGSTQGE